VSLPRDVKLVLRPEKDEWELIEQNPTLFEAVIVRESHVAPYPAGHSLESQPEKLLNAIRTGVIPLWRDPETAGLCSRSVLGLPATSRLLQTPYAHAFTLPLDPAVLIGRDARREALEIAIATQAGSETAVPPYFDVDRRDSAAAQVNLQLLRELAASVAEQVPTVIVQMTRHRFLSGLAAELAADYAAAGARRVVIRVRGLQSQHASAQELTAYLDAIEAFERRGLATLGDCAGMLGPVLVAGGASGFTTGTRFFRSVPNALVQRPGGGGGVPIAVQPVDAWTEVPRPAEQDVRSTRVANMQALRALTALAASDPEALIASLRRDGGAYPVLWAGVLAGRRRRAV
jgi:hypothetical protein